MIPEEKINEILASADITRIIADFYPLKSAGRNYKILCPFHQEKTPSFIISPDKQIFHCFGCGKGGNVFHFIMEHEKLSFPEAVKWVGQRIGVIVEDKAAGRSYGLYPVLEEVNSLFQKFLRSDTGKSARQYLTKRGIKEKTMKDFSLGYAPASELQLKGLDDLNLTLEQLKKGGIILEKDGRKYPYFRQRIVFPIFNAQGKTIAFGGRSLDDSSTPKYLNSPESEIFEKGKTLYGLNLTRKNILSEKKAVVVEGYMDLISLYGAGVKNVAASLGTSLTRWQIRILSRIAANTIYLVYDSDEAGERASLRSLELFIEEGLNPLTVKLPYPEDPDSFIRKYGKEKFDAQLKNSKNVVEFYLDCLKKHHDPETVEGKINISKVILPIIDKIQSSLMKSEYIKILAGALDTDEKVLAEEMSEKNKQQQYKSRMDYKSYYSKELSSNPTEEELVLSSMIIENDILEEDINEFRNDNLREIISQLYSKAKGKEQNKPSAVLNLLPADAREILSKIMANPFVPEYTPKQIIQKWRIKNREMKNRNEQIEKLQKFM